MTDRRRRHIAFLLRRICVTEVTKNSRFSLLTLEPDISRCCYVLLPNFRFHPARPRGGCTHSMHSRSRMTIGLRTPILARRNMSSAGGGEGGGDSRIRSLQAAPISGTGSGSWSTSPEPYRCTPNCSPQVRSAMSLLRATRTCTVHRQGRKARGAGSGDDAAATNDVSTRIHWQCARGRQKHNASLST